MSYQQHTMALERAAYDLVHDFKCDGEDDGPKAIAPFLNKTPTSVSNEVNPNYKGAKLGLVDAVLIELVTQQYPLLHEHARLCHHIALPLPEPDHISSDLSLFERFVAWQGAMGKTCQHIHEAFDPEGEGGADISQAEAEAIAMAGYKHMSLFLGFLHEINQISEPTQH